MFSFWTNINVGARIVPELLRQEGFCNAGALEPLLHPTIGLNPRSGKLHIHVMLASRKGQAAIFNLTGDIRGEARIVERVFGIGPSVLTEAVALLAQSLENREAAR